MSAKIQPAVDAVLDHVGLDVDTAIGGLFGAEKGAALVPIVQLPTLATIQPTSSGHMRRSDRDWGHNRFP